MHRAWWGAVALVTSLKAGLHWPAFGVEELVLLLLAAVSTYLAWVEKP